jgi:tight adherence protein B
MRDTTALLDLFTLLVFATLMAGVYALRRLDRRRLRRERAARRLAELVHATGLKQAVERQENGLAREQDRAPLADVPLIGTPIQSLWTGLAMLGWRQQLVRRVIALLAVALLGTGFAARQQMPLGLAALTGAAVAVGVAGLLYRRAMNRYLDELRLSLPEAVDAITRATRAGVPITNCFALVADNLSGPLAREFTLIDHWLRLGMPLRQAMQASAQRLTLSEYRFLAIIVIINLEAGSSIGDTLERLATALRERHELKLKVKSKTSEARASAKIVAALVPLALGYLYLSSPRDFRFLFNDPTGNLVLIYATVSVTLGLTITHWMVRRVG